MKIRLFQPSEEEGEGKVLSPPSGVSSLSETICNCSSSKSPLQINFSLNLQLQLCVVSMEWLCSLMQLQFSTQRNLVTER